MIICLVKLETKCKSLRRENKMNHYQIWNAIELFAHDHGMSCSALAKRSGLDPTTFNKSKRSSVFGQRSCPQEGR